VAQVLEHLLYKCKALSSNPNPTLKKKKKEAHHKKYTNHLFWTKMFKGLLTQGSKKKSEIGAFYKTMP
jgi:hypothetical protein